MTHIEEKDIIPLLDIVKSEYTKRIVEESPQTIKQDEKIEEALTQAMDIISDYEQVISQNNYLIRKYEVACKPVRRAAGLYTCPECGKIADMESIYCHYCGKKLLWIWSKAEKRTAKKKGCKKWKRN